MVKPLYTNMDMKTLKRMYDDYHSLEEIGTEINRSTSSVQQVVRREGWKRNSHTVRMVYTRGRGILKFGKTPQAIKQAIAKQEKAEKAKRRKELKARQKQAIAGLKAALAAGKFRNDAIRAAYRAGANLSQIGKVVGLTKQGVGLIVTPPKPKRYDAFHR